MKNNEHIHTNKIKFTVPHKSKLSLRILINISPSIVPDPQILKLISNKD